VPQVGFEPTRLTAEDFESSKSLQFHHRGIVCMIGFEPTAF
jgi:hypothetical protein